MPYADKEKQRKADRERAKHYRERIRGKLIKPEDVTPVTPLSSPLNVEPAITPDVVPMSEAELLAYWAAGNGTEYQQTLEVLVGRAVSQQITLKRPSFNPKPLSP